ncbi:MAG: molybdenum cofactor guanylyltransferase [Alphaproteobacteria bacterium]|nr:molybdenum cofactor guanylyltransferase [Alphaproteobacteria bacterium]
MAIKILYVILSGGQARRIGGKCKLLLDIGGMENDSTPNDDMLVLDYVLRLIPTQAVTEDAILLNCNDAPDKPALTKALQDRIGKIVAVTTDMPEFMGQGPLAGLLASLDYARRHQFDAVITFPSDTPFMPENLVTKLLESSDNGRKIVSAFSNGRVHPVVSLVSIQYHDALYDYLASGNRKIQPFFEAHDWRIIKFDKIKFDQIKFDQIKFEMQQAGDESYDPFININTEEDLQTARKIATALKIR